MSNKLSKIIASRLTNTTMLNTIEKVILHVKSCRENTIFLEITFNFNQLQFQKS